MSKYSRKLTFMVNETIKFAYIFNGKKVNRMKNYSKWYTNSWRSNKLFIINATQMADEVIHYLLLNIK